MSRLTGSIWPLAFVLTVVVGLSACSAPNAPAPGSTDQPVAGDIADNQAYVQVAGDSGDFSVKVPEGWAKSSTTGATTYTDKLNSISFEESAVASAPTVASVTAQVLPTLEATRANSAGAKVSTFTRSGGDGVHIAFEADSIVDPVTGSMHRDAIEVYLFWKNGHQVALTVEGPTSADNVDPWKIVSDSFAWSAP